MIDPKRKAKYLKFLLIELDAHNYNILNNIPCGLWVHPLEVPRWSNNIPLFELLCMLLLWVETKRPITQQLIADSQGWGINNI